MNYDESKEWLTNKELFLRIHALWEELTALKTSLVEDVGNLRTELRETRSIIKEYNGLRNTLNLVSDEVSNSCKRISKIEERQKAHTDIRDNLRAWGGWIIALLALIVTYFRTVI